MMYLRVDRSRTRLLLIMVAGIALVLAAIDVMWLHELSGPPEVDDNGVLTTRGSAQRRQDILWSSVFIVTGGAAAAFAAIGLGRRLPVVELTDDAMRLRVVGTSGYLDVPWNEIERITAGVDDTGNHVAEPIMIVRVLRPERFPHGLWGAEWRGNDLRIDAGSWSVPVEEVVVHANVLLPRLAARLDDETEIVEPVVGSDPVEPDVVETPIEEAGG